MPRNKIVYSAIIQLLKLKSLCFFSKHWECLVGVYGFMLLLCPSRAQIQSLSGDHTRRRWNNRISLWKNLLPERKIKKSIFHDHNYYMILPCRLLMQAVLVSTDLRASHSNCPVGKPLVDFFCSTSLQHPSFLGTDICMPTTEKQKGRGTQKIWV